MISAMNGPLGLKGEGCQVAGVAVGWLIGFGGFANEYGNPFQGAYKGKAIYREMMQTWAIGDQTRQTALKY